jgi:hypothetical protein
MDDYHTCDIILETLISRINPVDAENMLLRAVVLQQRSLRLRDSGRAGSQSSTEVAELLDAVDIKLCTRFNTAPAVDETSEETLKHIVAALRHAAWSSTSPFEREDESRSIPPWRVQIRTPTPEQLLLIDADRAHEYYDFLNETYKRIFRRGTVTVFGEQRSAELFFAQLSLELLGHSRVYIARKELALMRLIQNQTGLVDVPLGDVIRLLRHAGAEAELKLALDQIRSAGPLYALSDDARQILARRLKPNLLRPTELLVLQYAADSLTKDEAATALIAVQTLIDAGPLPSNSGFNQPQYILLEKAWMTAAALGNAAEREDTVAMMMLEAASDAKFSGHEVWDIAIGRSIRLIDWSRISKADVQKWGRWLAQSSEEMPATAEIIARQTGAPMRTLEGPATSLRDVADVLNNTIRRNNRTVQPSESSNLTRIVTDALSQIRADAARGTSSFGGIEAGDVAAAIIVELDVPELWIPLTEFLMDPLVAREHKSPAFERLARNRQQLPEDAALIFRENSHTLLDSHEDTRLSFDTIVPYPAALRFLSQYELISESEIFSRVAHLAGSDDSSTREQASSCLAEISKSQPSLWMLALATQLSHDASADVKANAGRSLALLESSLPQLSDVAARRIVELLNEDGLVVPLLLLREFRDVRELNSDVLAQINRLREEHPSRLVRVEAASLMSRETEEHTH